MRPLAETLGNRIVRKFKVRGRKKTPKKAKTMSEVSFEWRRSHGHIPNGGQ